MKEYKIVNGREVPLSAEDIAQREADSVREQAERAKEERTEGLRKLRRKAVDAFLEYGLDLESKKPSAHPDIKAYTAAKSAQQPSSA